MGPVNFRFLFRISLFPREPNRVVLLISIHFPMSGTWTLQFLCWNLKKTKLQKIKPWDWKRDWSMRGVWFFSLWSISRYWFWTRWTRVISFDTEFGLGLEPGPNKFSYLYAFSNSCTPFQLVAVVVGLCFIDPTMVWAPLPLTAGLHPLPEGGPFSFIGSSFLFAISLLD